jgi:hypothetical protein
MNVKKSITILLILLIILNIIIRVPSIPHENGNDSFMLHTLANSITQFGEAKWWLSIYSIFGMYSYSYASAIPFLLSGINQLTGIDTETSIWVMSVPLGLLSMFSAYIMAGEIKNDFVFKFLFAAFYSISQGILQFTIWNTSSRGLFLVMLPLFIYITIKDRIPFAKKVIMTIGLFVFLRSVHNFSYFLLPIIAVYIFARTVIEKDTFKIVREYSKYFTHIYVAMLVSSIILPFFARLFMIGSRYQAFLNSLITLTRYTGPLIVFSFTGLIYAIFNSNKDYKDWIILLLTIGFAPMFYSLAYGPFILLLPIIYFISIGYRNLFALEKRRKSIHAIIVILILFSVAFSSYYTHFRTGSSSDYWFMDERTNVAGIWTRTAFEENSRILTSGAEIWRLTAIANGHAVFPTIPPVALTYEFVSSEEAYENTLKTKPLSEEYFFDGPYVQKEGTSSWGTYSWISNFEIQDSRTTNFIDTYNLKYAVFDSYSMTPISRNMDSHKNKIYENSRIRMYSL